MNILKSIKPINEDESINVIVEIQKGSKNKYEYDKDLGILKLDRVMKTGQDYPFDYGFVPNTLWHDGDPIDVVLYTTYPINAGTLVEARPVAIMHMTDTGDSDAKIIAVPTTDPRLKEMQNLETAPKYFLKEVQHFFETYKSIENKKVTIDGIDDADVAKKAIKESIELYESKNK